MFDSIARTIKAALGLTPRFPYTADQIATASILWHCGQAVGWDDETCASFLGNVDGECSMGLHLWGDKDPKTGKYQATDIMQDHEPNRTMIFSNTGIDMVTASAADQFRGIYWEMTTAPSWYRKVNAQFMAADGIEAKVTVLVQQIEKSGSQARDIVRRTGLATAWLAYAQEQGWGRVAIPSAQVVEVPLVHPVPKDAPAVVQAAVAVMPAVAPLVVPTAGGVATFDAAQYALPELKWVPSPNFSERSGHGVERIIIHDCEGYYVGSVVTFQGNNGGNPVSAHFVLRKDGKQATQMVRLSKKAWHCVLFNSTTIGIEMEGFEKFGYPDTEWTAAEAMAAFLCQLYGLPAVWAPHPGQKGICRHYDLGKAGGGHTDPTLDMVVWNTFLQRTAALAASGTVPKTWPGLQA